MTLTTVIQTQIVPTPWDRLPVPAKLVTKVMECHVQVSNGFTLLCECVLACVFACVCACVQACARACVRVCMRAYLRASLRECLCACLHAC